VQEGDTRPEIRIDDSDSHCEKSLVNNAKLSLITNHAYWPKVPNAGFGHRFGSFFQAGNEKWQAKNLPLASGRSVRFGLLLAIALRLQSSRQ
jgi:hypothetical protein